MTRRDFLKSIAGLLTVSAVGSIVREKVERKQMPSPFRLYGDGIHDDSAAFQALMNGEKVLYRDWILEGQNMDGIVYLPTGTYLIGRTT